MTLVLHRSDDFNRDFDLQYRWYLEQAGEVVAGLQAECLHHADDDAYGEIDQPVRKCFHAS